MLFRTFGGGVVTDQPPLGEGFHIIAPWNKVYVYNVKQQEFFEANMQVLSSNGLEISLDVSVLHQPKYDELGLLQTKARIVNIVLIPKSVPSRDCCWTLHSRTVVFDQTRRHPKRDF